MRILIIGASGMAGHLIATYFKEKNHQVFTLASSHPYDNQTTLLNVCDPLIMESYLSSHAFDVIINCAGLLVEASEKNKTQAVLLNSYFPHYLEQFYMHTKTKIIHLSTDCVFSGYHGPYDEKAIPDGLLFYDQTKALGELNNKKDLTLRMSIIGPDRFASGIGLLNWFLQQKDVVYGFSNVYWNGVTTLLLAQAIEAALDQNLTGLYHLVADNPVSKYELLSLFKQTFGCETMLLAKEVTPINKALVNTRTDFNFHVPSYPTMLVQLKNWILVHLSFYPHYAHLLQNYLQLDDTKMNLINKEGLS